MIIRKRELASFALLVVLGGCSVTASERSRLDWELVTQEQQQLEEIQATPTHFILEFENDQYAWERAQLFFKEFTSHTSKTESDLPVWNMELSSAASIRDRFLYRVRKNLTRDGFEYIIEAEPNRKLSGVNTKAIFDAQLNSKNLARFIKEGALERSLLVR